MTAKMVDYDGRDAPPGVVDEAEYKAFLNPDVIWWPWWVAEEYLYRKTRKRMLRTSLIALAQKGRFSAGKHADAPLKKYPVDKASFMDWVHGHATKRREERRAVQDLAELVKTLTAEVAQLAVATRRSR